VNLEAEQYMKTKPLYPASAMDNCQLKDDLGENLDIYYSKWESLRMGK
jgi:spermidine/putrescine transport system substrate-binding protein